MLSLGGDLCVELACFVPLQVNFFPLGVATPTPAGLSRWVGAGRPLHSPEASRKTHWGFSRVGCGSWGRSPAVEVK